MRRVVWIVVAAGALLLALDFRARLQPVYHGPPGSKPLVIEGTPGPALAFSIPVASLQSGLVTLAPPPEGLVIHYWATWNRESAAEIAALDSLVRSGQCPAQVVAVTADPMPSVARYARRRHITLAILLDPGRALEPVAPLKAIPSTYVFDSHGRLLVYREGPVDWWAPRTLETLRATARSGDVGPGPAGT